MFFRYGTGGPLVGSVPQSVLSLVVFLAKISKFLFYIITVLSTWLRLFVHPRSSRQSSENFFNVTFHFSQVLLWSLLTVLYRKFTSSRCTSFHRQMHVSMYGYKVPYTEYWLPFLRNISLYFRSPFSWFNPIYNSIFFTSLIFDFQT